MKKKLLTLALAALLIVSLMPALAFAATESVSGTVPLMVVNGNTLPQNGDGTIPEASGTGWTYADGVLTLNGYKGGPIGWGFQMNGPVSDPQTLTIDLQGENTLTPDGFGILTVQGNLVFQGNGTLRISAQDGIFPVQAFIGKVSFKLSPGGKVILAATGNLSGDIPRPAITAYGKWQSDMPEATTSLDQFTLDENNVILQPEGGKVNLFGWDPPADADSELAAVYQEITPTEVVASPNAAFTMATVLDAAGQPAQNVTIAVPLPQEEPSPAVPGTPGAVTPKTPAKTPKTGDSGLEGLALLLAAAGAVSAVGIARRKFQ